MVFGQKGLREIVYTIGCFYVLYPMCMVTNFWGHYIIYILNLGQKKKKNVYDYKTCVVYASKLFKRLIFLIKW